ncbi:MAG TPA: acyl-CoA-binding protein [Gammaproteobacteria bacterium]|nr:acyl-CoA-binding protein [Gammaproteobacteria bacterium]
MTDDLKAGFEQASVDVKGLSQRPKDEDMLALYALYKQATEGDVSGGKPGFFDFVARAKYEAWEALQGTSAEDAMQRYIDKVRALGA